jgi:hypothetical protein
MRRLAELLSVHDAVVIVLYKGRDAADRLGVQTWHDRTEGALEAGFSSHRLAEGETPHGLLEPLAPPVPVVHRRPRGPVVPDRPWYRRRGVQASIAVGVLGAVVGSVVLVRSLDDQVGLGRDLTFLPPRMAGQ